MGRSPGSALPPKLTPCEVHSIRYGKPALKPKNPSPLRDERHCFRGTTLIGRIRTTHFSEGYRTRSDTPSPVTAGDSVQAYTASAFSRQLRGELQSARAWKCSQSMTLPPWKAGRGLLFPFTVFSVLDTLLRNCTRGECLLSTYLSGQQLNCRPENNSPQEHLSLNHKPNPSSPIFIPLMAYQTHCPNRSSLRGCCITAEI